MEAGGVETGLDGMGGTETGPDRMGGTDVGPGILGGTDAGPDVINETGGRRYPLGLFWPLLHLTGRTDGRCGR